MAGAIAHHAYTGIWRDTNDLDIFLRARDVKTALDAMADAGFETRVENGIWIAKAFWNGFLVDLIFDMRNGLMPVTDDWFETGNAAEIAGVETRLISLEELIAAKVYIALRLRFDGADIVHLIRSARGNIDWQRVLKRLGGNRPLLLWHFILFDYVYPGHSAYLPRDLVESLYQEMREGWSSAPEDEFAFRGSVLDPYSFSVDIEEWGYRDQSNKSPRITPGGELI